MTPTLLGNQTTAKRLSNLLGELGHNVVLRQKYDNQSYELLIALHARRSGISIKKFRQNHSNVPIILILTGTDLYHDIRNNVTAKNSLETSDRLVTLQKLGELELPSQLQEKTRSILQSATPTPGSRMIRSAKLGFQIAVVGGLRPVKDPFRTSMAVRKLPAFSAVNVVHVGPAMSKQMETRAFAESKKNPRYCWIGEQTHLVTRQIIRDSDLLVLSSRSEGGANVISEALADSTPILASRNPGSVGVLGQNYPGLFAIGDTRGLTNLIRLAESNRDFLDELKSRCKTLKRLVSPRNERKAWENLLREIQQNF